MLLKLALYKLKFLVINWLFRRKGYTQEIRDMLVQSAKKEKQNTPISSKANYRREIKLKPINMDYCLLQFDALKFFLWVHLHVWSLPNFDYFKTPKIWQQDRQVHRSNCLDTNFHNISEISLTVIRRRNYN